MKKILLLILAFAMAVSLASCGEDSKDPIDKFNEIYKLSQPTMVETTAVTKRGIHTLNSHYVFAKGQVDGKNATQYVKTYDKFATVDEGISDIVTGPIVTVTESKEYVEGKGIRTNGGSWTKGSDFAPEAGALVLNITKELLTDYTYTDNVLSATVEADNTEAVFGVAYPADVVLEIATNGIVVTSISISYEIEEDGDYPAGKVEIETVYSYHIQSITLVPAAPSKQK